MFNKLTRAIALSTLILTPHALAQDAAPERWGYGRWVEPKEIAAWDIDVKPDGSGLPEGMGNVATGEAVYMARCANCHGLDGVDGSFDVLAGRIRGDDFPLAKIRAR